MCAQGCTKDRGYALKAEGLGCGCRTFVETFTFIAAVGLKMSDPQAHVITATELDKLCQRCLRKIIGSIWDPV